MLLRGFVRFSGLCLLPEQGGTCSVITKHRSVTADRVLASACANYMSNSIAAA